MLVDFLNTYKLHIFIFTVIIIHYILNILIYINVNVISKETVHLLNALLQISISLFLIFRFRFSDVSKSSILSNFDKQVIVSCASFMLLNVITGVIFERFEKQIRNYLSKYSAIGKKETSNLVTSSLSSLSSSSSSQNNYSFIKEPMTVFANTNSNTTNETETKQKYSILDYLPNEV
jgi:cytochrome b subunit of formate dehydrogenase